MPQIVKLRAPWMEIDEVCRTLERVNTCPRKWRAETLARELRVTNAERLLLDLRTIAPFDMTPEERQQDRKARDRLRKRLRRRTVERRKSRDEWLATSKMRNKPWETARISRRSWYRQQAKLNGTGVSAIKLGAEPDGTGVSAIMLPTAADRPVPASKPLSREEGGRARVSQLAKARPPSKSKLLVQDYASASAD